jgi:KUP system potassium uptake protein
MRDDSSSSTFGLALLAIGIVFGDIGTSPLYAFKAIFDPAHGIPLTTETIFGSCSCVFWALMLVVTLKYVTFILRATNNNEGGIMAMLALVRAVVRERSSLYPVLIFLGLIGAALFYGDAVLTPTISVLSAIEGLEIGSSLLARYTVPIAIAIMIGLFAFQRYGTALIGRFFAPVCIVWFIAIAGVGTHQIIQTPEILNAFNPWYAVNFLTTHGISSFFSVLGSILLAYTGAEALYADVGHFGRKAIRLAWFMIFPALILSYFGQGALLIKIPEALSNPFYLACPEWALYPMVAIATLATIIASQAVISGTYSITQQAIRLHYLPRMRIFHTSADERGQIYMPLVNTILLVLVLFTILHFGTSSALSNAILNMFMKFLFKNATKPS